MKLLTSKTMSLFIVFLILLGIGCVEEGGIENVEKTQSTSSNDDAQSSISEIGTYKNPAKIGNVITISSYGTTFKVSIEEVVRGQKANSEIASANMFNEEPSSGYEYLLVKAKLEYVEGDDPASTGSWDFKAYSDDVQLETGYSVTPDNYKEFTMGDVMPGGTKTGWLTYLVPQNKEVIMSYSPNMFSDNAAYISIGS